MQRTFRMTEEDNMEQRWARKSEEMEEKTGRKRRKRRYRSGSRQSRQAPLMSCRFVFLWRHK